MLQYLRILNLNILSGPICSIFLIVIKRQLKAILHNLLGTVLLSRLFGKEL